VNLKSTMQLYADITPWDASNRDVTWSSDNTAIASVSNIGIVSGESLGTAIISAKTNDGQKLVTTTVNVVLPPANKLISNCESTSGWTSSNTLTLNSLDKKEGNASLQSAGNKTDEFKYRS
jgi:beta-fructofuranosidase